MGGLRLGAAARGARQHPDEPAGREELLELVPGQGVVSNKPHGSNAVTAGPEPSHPHHGARAPAMIDEHARQHIRTLNIHAPRNAGGGAAIRSGGASFRESKPNSTALTARRGGCAIGLVPGVVLASPSAERPGQADHWQHSPTPVEAAPDVKPLDLGVLPVGGRGLLGGHGDDVRDGKLQAAA